MPKDKTTSAEWNPSVIPCVSIWVHTMCGFLCRIGLPVLEQTSVLQNDAISYNKKPVYFEGAKFILKVQKHFFPFYAIPPPVG